jgi:hypothetical protein
MFLKPGAKNANNFELVAPTGFVRWWAKTSSSRFVAWPSATSEPTGAAVLPEIAWMTGMNGARRMTLPSV